MDNIEVIVTANGATVRLDLAALNDAADQCRKRPGEIKAGLLDWHDHIVSALWFFATGALDIVDGAMPLPKLAVLLVGTSAPFCAVLGCRHIAKRRRAPAKQEGCYHVGF